MKFETLNDLFLMKIMSLYDIELVLTKALPKMAKAAKSPELKKVFAGHLEETEKHVKRLEKIFHLLGEKPRKTKVEAIRGLVEDGSWVMKQKMPDESKDAALIGAARYVEHYEMAGYLALLEWARQLGNVEIKGLISDSLEEEENADSKLKEIGIEISQNVGQEA